MLRYTLIASALACGLALAGPTVARAAPHAGGHGGHAGGHAGGHGGHAGGHASAYHGGYGNYYGGYGHYGHGYYGHGHHNYWAVSIGLGLGYGGYGGYGGYPVYYGYAAYPAYYSYPAYYTDPVYSVGYASPVITTPAGGVVSDPPVVSDGTVVPAGNGNGQSAKPNAAQMEVRLPDTDAEVWVDGRQTRARGRNRVLVSPELVPGKAYVYKVTAAWTRDGKRVAEERVVDVTAGKTSVVDFTAAANGHEALPFPMERAPEKVPPAAK